MDLQDLKRTYPQLSRSIDTYYGSPERDRNMDRLYRRFVTPGAICYDIGSHVGDRIASFRRLGARVVALEPQPDCVAVLSALYGEDSGVAIEPAACGATAGSLIMNVNSSNPTITTASQQFVIAAKDAKGWEDQVWDRQIEVACVTLDNLIARHGIPAFIKIDVEGFEDQVLKGLSRSVAALSFEFTTIERDVAHRCLDCLAQLGAYRFDVAIGETQALVFGEGHEVSADRMATYIETLPHDANSGDVYAVLRC